MERYLEGQELVAADVAHALKTPSHAARSSRSPAASRRRTWGRLRCSTCSSRASRAREEGTADRARGPQTAAFVFKTIADPFAGHINVFRVLKGRVSSDPTLIDSRTHAKERVGLLLSCRARSTSTVQEFGEGDIGAVAKLKEVQTGDLLLDAEHKIEPPELEFPEPVMSFAVTPKAKGDEEKMATALRRLAEEDPTLVMRRDEQTGEQLLSGPEPDPRRGRGRAAQAPVQRGRRPSPAARAVPGDDPAPVPRPRPLQEADRRPRAVRRRPHRPRADRRGHAGYEFVDEIVGGVIPQGFRPGSGQGHPGGDADGRAGGAPVQGDARAARGRLVPHRRLVRDGVQDRGLHGLQAGVRAGRAGAARADHGSRRDRPPTTPWARSTAISTRAVAACSAWSPRAG